MTWIRDNWRFLAIGITALLAAYYLLSPVNAKAADLGGNCCSDLEERIAELEATTARKGNRKVSLQVYGQVNAALLHVDVADFNDTKVTQQGSDTQGTFVGFSGYGKITSDMSAGYVLEIDFRQRGLPDEVLGVGVGGNPDPGVRQSFFWLRSEALGTASLGRTGQATQKFDEISTANTAIVARPNSLQPLSDAYLTGFDIPYDGKYRDLVRYDSPTWNGFTLSASWGDAVSTDPDGDGETYDVALRYSGEFSGMQIKGGLGWRHDEDLRIDILDVTSITIPTGDVETVLVSGSVKHVASGLFLSAYYADQQYDLINLDLRTWTVQGGLESKWLTTLGATTVYAEYSETDIEGLGPDANVPVYGLAVVQAIDAAALDLYLGYRQYDLDEVVGEKVDAVQAGARIRF